MKPFMYSLFVMMFAIAPAAGVLAQRSFGPTPSVAVEADADDQAAAMLATSLRDQLRKSARYRLAAGTSAAEVVIHVVGLAIPSCRPTSAIAVSYVALPTEKHLGTAVLTTDRSRVASSAKEVLTRLPNMLADAGK